jgi:predicted dehydrogenase
MHAKVRIGVIGCGEVSGAKHLPVFAHIAGATVAAVCDLDQALARSAASRFGIPQVADSAAELLALGDIDLVAVLTPPASHAELAIAALRAGHHVYVEKPLALSVADSEAMLAEARRSGRTAVTGFHMRFHRLVRDARDIVRSGRLGAIESIRLVWHSPRGDQPTQPWKTVRDAGGGALVEIGVHHIDLVRFLLDDEIARIAAQTRDGVREDECATIMALTARGILVTGEFSERSPHEIEIVISGRQAMLRVDCLRADGLEVRDARDVPGAPRYRLRRLAATARSVPMALRPKGRHSDYLRSYDAIWRHVIECVARGTTPEVSFEDGVRAARVLHAARTSRSAADMAACGVI